MTTAPQRFPLAWPAHRPRRRWQDRTKGDFVANGRAITLAAAADKLERQIEALGGKYPVLSSNVELRLDGKPRADRSPPADPGACVYFELKGKPMAMACDAYTSVQMNIAAIANHIDAVRRQARYGVASAEESLQAFAALPAPGGRHWTAVLGLPRATNADEVKAAHRRLMLENHPDRGGEEREMAEVNAARDAALKEIGA